MIFLKHLKVYVIHFIISLNMFGKIDTTVNSYLFEKAIGVNVKLTHSMHVISAPSLIGCCLTCKYTTECGSLNYNSLSVEDNCELIRSGLDDTVVDLQQGWNVYFETGVSASCADGWTSVGSSCYRLENETLTWSDAQARCAEHTNGHLVHISNGEENELVKSIYLSQHPDGQGYIWIGLSDLDELGIHKWTDGTVLSSTDYANWGAGQDGAGGEQCIILFRPQDFNWHDISCEGAFVSVCEIDLI